MKGRNFLLPVLTAGAVLLAVTLPMAAIGQWDRGSQDVLHQESANETAPVANYTLSGSDRLQLLRYSGIAAQAGEIVYGQSSGNVSAEVRQVESIASGAAEEGTETETPADSDGGTEESASASAEEVPTATDSAGNYLLSPLQDGNISEHIDDYLVQGLCYLADSNAISYDLLLHYQEAARTIQVDYCSVTDDSAPFYSISLLCVSVSLEDAALYGIEHDTAFSVVLDEESGAVYAFSLRSDPALELTEGDDYGFIILAELIGLTCTESSELTGEDGSTRGTRFNFSGYSFLLERFTDEATGCAVLEFNIDRK